MSKDYDATPEITQFVRELVSAKILSPGEAATLALTFRDVRGRPQWGAMANVAATRAAHKKYGPGN